MHTMVDAVSAVLAWGWFAAKVLLFLVALYAAACFGARNPKKVIWSSRKLAEIAEDAKVGALELARKGR
jgi:hypothetical protein